MINFSPKYRIEQEEVMDDFSFNGSEMRRLLDDLNRVNTWLGGFRTTLGGLEALLHHHDPGRLLTVVDFGCGDGNTLRRCDSWLRTRFDDYQLIGIDANPHIVEEAQKRSEGYQHLRFECMDIFSDKARAYNYDIAIFSLFLHHFQIDQIHIILKQVLERSRLGIVINDLERNFWAFYLFRIFGRLLLRTKTAYSDGLISVARGFTQTDFKQLAKQLDGKHQISKKRMFRLQWLIQTP